ncbi:alpha/beta hydrolase [Streptomyces sp. NPDC004610]|uniref:alpha/beta hydrolase n=1 Tax=unclassified Streptomyces TaxID=2593676 RepID=UPI0033BDB9FB
MRRRRLAPLLAVSVMATLAPVLAISPTASAATAATSAASGLERYVRQDPQWTRCRPDSPAEFECATIKVPLDYRKPGGKQLDLAISRIKSTSPEKREGVLLSNPGGPGGEGLTLPLYLQEVLPQSVQQEYDLIGFDPRGVGQSSPVTCDLTLEEEDWLRPYKEETYAEDVAWAREVADKCRENSGDTLAHITTRNTARDMDLIRAVLGERRVSYLGYSYGTYLGAVYTQLFPGRADRIVLDSGVDPARAWRGMIQWWAEGAEPAFDRWTEWAAERDGRYDLGDTPKDVDRTFWDLVEQAEEEPIDLGGQPITADQIRMGMRGLVFTPVTATEAIVELKQAAEGRPASAAALTPFTDPLSAAALTPPTDPVSAAGSGAGADTLPDLVEVPADNMTASFWAVVCGDNSAAWSRDPETYREDALADRARYPLFGDFASSIKPCAFWDDSVEPVTEVRNRVGSLVVQNEWDSQTPLPSAQALHSRLRGSKMVTVLGGEGHGVYPSANACTDGTVERYLLTGRLPKRDVACEATPASGDADARRGQQRPDVLPGAPDRF